jgi:hypothetical protein
VVVLGNVLLATQRTEVRHLEALGRLDLHDLALVLVRPPLLLALPDDPASLLPIGHDLRTEHVLLDLLRIGQCCPDLRGRCIDFDFGGCYVVPPGSLLVISRDTAPEPKGRPCALAAANFEFVDAASEPTGAIGLSVAKCVEVGGWVSFDGEIPRLPPEQPSDGSR